MTLDNADGLFDFSAAPEPTLLWRAVTQRFYDAPALRMEGPRLYVNGCALDPDTGRRIDEDAGPTPNGLLADLDGTIFTLEGGRSRQTVMARTPTHQLKWSSALRPAIFNGPMLSLCQGLLLISGAGQGGFSSQRFIKLSKGYVLALDPQSGDLLWMFATDGEVSHRPVVSNSRLFLADSDYETRHVYCLSTTPKSRLGECLWQCQLAGAPQAGTEAGGFVYWGSYSGPTGAYLYALDAATGTVRWRFHAKRPVASLSPPCVIDDWVFFPCEEGYIYGLDRLTGALRWKTMVGDAKTITETPTGVVVTDAASGFEGWSEEERREWEQYEKERETQRDTPLESKGSNDDEDTAASERKLATWAFGNRLYVLEHNGFMGCYIVPRATLRGSSL